jgi:hypothetical protein
MSFGKLPRKVQATLAPAAADALATRNPARKRPLRAARP